MSGLVEYQARALAEKQKTDKYPKYALMNETEALNLRKKVVNMITPLKWVGYEQEGFAPLKRNPMRVDRIQEEMKEVNKAAGRVVFIEDPSDVKSVVAKASLADELMRRLLPADVYAPIKPDLPPEPLDPRRAAERLAEIDRSHDEEVVRGIFKKEPELPGRLKKLDIPTSAATDPRKGKYFSDYTPYGIEKVPGTMAKEGMKADPRSDPGMRRFYEEGEGEGKPRRRNHRKNKIVHLVSLSKLGRGCGC
jgi:hypothetical protein